MNIRLERLLRICGYKDVSVTQCIEASWSAFVAIGWSATPDLKGSQLECIAHNSGVLVSYTGYRLQKPVGWRVKR